MPKGKMFDEFGFKKVGTCQVLKIITYFESMEIRIVSNLSLFTIGCELPLILYFGSTNFNV